VARATIQEHLGDVPFVERGWSSRHVTSRGPGLAVEYARRAVVAELKPIRADVVVAASHFAADAAAVHAAKRIGAHGVAYIYHLIANRTDAGLRTRWSKADEAIGLRLLRTSAETVFASNDETARQLEERGFEPLRTNVGLDLGSFKSGVARNAPPVVLFIARLVAKKGLGDLIRAWPLVRERVPGARLVVAGDGPERLPNEQLATKLGINSSIEWKGFISEAEKRHLLATARVFAAPSYEEGWGIAVAEAMASSLPVVAYRLSTLDEVFGDGYVAVSTGEVDQLGAALARLLADDEEADRVAARGMASVAGYDVGVVAEQELETILSRAGCARSR
jgi:glycosyltransferase involved in cell wall biosynthesis